MVEDSLVEPTDLVGFPGAPFAPNVVRSAAGQVRDVCGWHVAPVVSEQVTVEAAGQVVLLPSLRVRSVESVTADGVPVTGWSFASNGVLRRAAGWPAVITVDFTHGYESCPAGLLAVLAEFGQRITSGAVKQESLSGRSVSFDTSSGATSMGVLARYALPGRP